MSNSRHGFVKNKSCQHDPISFCVKKVLFTVSIFCLLLRKTFDAAFQNGLKAKHRYYGVGENSVGYTWKSCLVLSLECQES